MMLPWIITGAALLIALLAWHRSRQTANRLEQLSQMYWELKYQHGELRVQVQRLIGEPTIVPPPAPTRERPTEQFVPLSSLRGNRA